MEVPGVLVHMERKAWLYIKYMVRKIDGALGSEDQKVARREESDAIFWKKRKPYSPRYPGNIGLH